MRTVRELRAKLEAAEQTAVAEAQKALVWVTEVEKQQAHVTALREALVKYGNHTTACIEKALDWGCTCGFEDVFEETKP